MTMLRAGVTAGLLLAAVETGAAQMAPDARRGLVLAKTHCSQCHSIDRVGASPLSVAPPFRDLHNRYPVESLPEAFAEGISAGHPSMPQFQFDPDQIDDLIASSERWSEARRPEKTRRTLP